jgi:hypothetical protein
MFSARVLGLAGVRPRSGVLHALVRPDVDPVVGGLLELDVGVLPLVGGAPLGEGVAARSELPTDRLLGRVVVSCPNLLRPLPRGPRPPCGPSARRSRSWPARRCGRPLGLGLRVDVLGVGEVFVAVEVIPVERAVRDRGQGGLERVFGRGVRGGLRRLGLRPKVGYRLAVVAADNAARARRSKWTRRAAGELPDSPLLAGSSCGRPTMSAASFATAAWLTRPPGVKLARSSAVRPVALACATPSPAFRRRWAS